MKHYEYRMLKDSDTSSYSIEDINELGKEGWRVVWTDLNDGGHERTLLERETVV